MQPATILEQIASQGSKSIIPLIVSSGMARDKVHRIGRAESVESKLRDAGAAAFRLKKKRTIGIRFVVYTSMQTLDSNTFSTTTQCAVHFTTIILFIGGS